MGLEKLIKREIAITISVVILVTTIFLMFSYAIFKVEVETENNVITFGKISMSFCKDSSCNSTLNNVSNAIGTTKDSNGNTQYIKIYPQADPTTTAEWNKLSPYTFSLTNDGDLDLNVSLYLEKDTTPGLQYTVDGRTSSVAIEDQYVKIGIGESTATPTIKLYSSTLVDGTHRIANGITLKPGETKIFKLYAWLVSNAPNASQGKYFTTLISARGEFIPAS